ncbi:hypothetical protein Pyrde_1988 [Pyrodictium delaneyi]|uniref:DUF3194 domain-containing protein n=1 Tax=Pyrodictium delaneyi TaxID=1273541 RepID=A0A0P0N532_9CREN|nr:hypothetical protein [Pyrodictium delaneyi]ALL02031.1 hypothetical protein Pyrde_1988 [Pyrodictium delaneyi]
MPRIVSVGLEEKPLTPEELEKLLAGVERIVSKHLERVLRRRLEELDLIVEGELSPDGKSLRINIDVRVTGRLIAPLSYDEVVAEAIDEAARWLEEQLRARMAQEKDGGDAKSSRRSGYADSSHGAS